MLGTIRKDWTAFMWNGHRRLAQQQGVHRLCRRYTAACAAFGDAGEVEVRVKRLEAEPEAAFSLRGSVTSATIAVRAGQDRLNIGDKAWRGLCGDITDIHGHNQGASGGIDGDAGSAILDGVDRAILNGCDFRVSNGVACGRSDIFSGWKLSHDAVACPRAIEGDVGCRPGEAQCGFCNRCNGWLLGRRCADGKQRHDAQWADLRKKAPCIHGFQHSCVHPITVCIDNDDCGLNRTAL